jgi:hypothetical protein
MSIFSALAHHSQNGMRAAGALRIAMISAIKAGYVARVPASEISTVRQNEEAETSPV